MSTRGGRVAAAAPPTAVRPSHKPVGWIGQRVRAARRGARAVPDQWGGERPAPTRVSAPRTVAAAPRRSRPPQPPVTPSLPAPTRTPPPNRTLGSRHRQPVVGSEGDVRSTGRAQGRREDQFCIRGRAAPATLQHTPRHPPPAAHTSNHTHVPGWQQASWPAVAGAGAAGRPFCWEERRGGAPVRGVRRSLSPRLSSAVWWPLAPRITAAAAHVGACHSAATLDQDRGTSAAAGGHSRRARRRGLRADATPPPPTPPSSPQSRAFGGPTQPPHSSPAPHSPRQVGQRVGALGRWAARPLVAAGRSGQPARRERRRAAHGG